MGLSAGENLDQTVTLLHVREIRRYNDWVFSHVRPHLGDSILEVGCGIGTYSRRLREFAGRLVCVDLQPTYVRAVAHEFAGDDAVVVLLGELGRGLNFRPGSFDTIVCLNVIEHVEDDDAVVAQMSEWLAPGGRLMVQVPAHRWLHGSIDRALGHHRRYTKDQLRELLRRHSLTIVGGPRYLFGAAVPGWWWHGRVRRANQVPEGSVRLVNALAGLSRAVEWVLRSPFGITLVAAGRRGEGDR